MDGSAGEEGEEYAVTVNSLFVIRCPLFVVRYSLSVVRCPLNDPGLQ